MRCDSISASEIAATVLCHRISPQHLLSPSKRKVFRHARTLYCQSRLVPICRSPRACQAIRLGFLRVIILLKRRRVTFHIRMAIRSVLVIRVSLGR